MVGVPPVHKAATPSSFAVRLKQLKTDPYLHRYAYACVVRVNMAVRRERRDKKKVKKNDIIKPRE